MTNNAWNTDGLLEDGELLIGSDSGRALANTLTAGSANVTIVNGAGSSTISTNTSSSQWLKISSATASSSSSIDFTGLSSTYKAYRLFVIGLKPATDSTELYFRTSTNNGVSFDSGASDYEWGFIETDTSANNVSTSTADTKIQITGNDNGTGTNETADLELTLFDPSSTTFTKVVWSVSMADSSSATRRSYNGGGYRKGTTAVNAIRLIMSSGNISSGTFILYGIEA